PSLAWWIHCSCSPTLIYSAGKTWPPRIEPIAQSTYNTKTKPNQNHTAAATGQFDRCGGTRTPTTQKSTHTRNNLCAKRLRHLNKTKNQKNTKTKQNQKPHRSRNRTFRSLRWHSNTYNTKSTHTRNNPCATPD
ncbi:unnamed protein product, partial [Ectocarpus fasciculatus]